MAEMYTMARWTVKAGKESDFVDLWSGMSQWSEMEFSDSVAMRLMRNAQDPQEFYSIGTWESLESIDRWKSDPQAKSYAQELGSLCDDVKQTLLEPIISVEDRGELLEQPIK